MTLTERIEEIIKRSGVTRAEFERNACIPRDKLVNGIKSGSDRYSSDVLIQILKYCPTINPAWLLLEEGSMLKEPDTKKSEHPKQIHLSGDGVGVSSDSPYKQLYEEYKNMVVAKDARISELEKQLIEKDKQYNESEREFHLTIRQLARQYSPASAIPSPTVNPTSKSGIGEAKLHRDLK